MRLGASDIQGLSRLAITASTGITDLVEAMHRTVNSPLGLTGGASRTRGFTGLVYRSVRAVMKFAGNTLETSISPFVAAEPRQGPTSQEAAVVAALNGVFGDHLAATKNPLAIEMTLRAHGAANDGPGTSKGAKVAVLLHGLCMNDRQWRRKGHDHGEALARDLGYSVLYLRYNSGLHISTNGRAFATLLESMLAEWPQPIDELVLVAHSMGGLVARSACHAAEEAKHDWLRQLRKIVFLGTPHHGAPLERGGHWANLLLGAVPYAAPFARLGHARSAGITDLRHGSLLDEDWVGVDRFAPRLDERHPVPLPKGVRCFAAAACLGSDDTPWKGTLRGDGLVPVACALGHHQRDEHALHLPPDQQWIGYGMNHMDLLSRPEVYAQLKKWLAAD